MIYAVVTAPSAASDIIERIKFVSEKYPEYADRLSDKFYQAIDSLSFAPKRYKPGRLNGTRESFEVSDYCIVFRIDENTETVEVLHVYHQKQKRD